MGIQWYPYSRPNGKRIGSTERVFQHWGCPFSSLDVSKLGGESHRSLGGRGASPCDQERGRFFNEFLDVKIDTVWNWYKYRNDTYAIWYMIGVQRYTFVCMYYKFVYTPYRTASVRQASHVLSTETTVFNVKSRHIMSCQMAWYHIATSAGGYGANE